MNTGGSDTLNGGMFDPSQTAGMFTDGAATSATTSAPVFSSASYNFVAGDVGAWVYVGAGTNWLFGWYKIASVAANAATLTATLGLAVLSTGGATASYNGISTATGCASTGSPTGATWTIDYSQQTAAQFAYTDLASVGAGSTVSSTGKPFAGQQVGNCIVVTGGTNFTTGRYIIASVAAGVATVAGAAALTTGAGINGTGGQGGAFLTHGAASAVMVAGNDIFYSGNYTITSASSNVAAGCITSIGGASASNTTKWIGYQTTRGDNGTKPVLTASGITTFTMFTGVANVRLENTTFDGANLTGSKGVAGNVSWVTYRCKFANMKSAAANTGTSHTCILCEATGCSTTAPFTACNCWGCVAHDNTITGFSTSGACIKCVSSNNTGATSDGFLMAQVTGIPVVDCVAYKNGRDGFRTTANANNATTYINCVSTDNGVTAGTAYGYNGSAATDNVYLINCAGYNNLTGLVNNANIPAGNVIGLITITAGSPFTNAAGNDFSPNNTANQGALLRAAGIPGSTATYQLPGISTLSYPDVGAAQHQDLPPVISMNTMVFRALHGAIPY